MTGTSTGDDRAERPGRKLLGLGAGLVLWTFLIGLCTTLFGGAAPWNDGSDVYRYAHGAAGVDSWFATSAVPLAVGAWLLARGGRPFSTVLISVPIVVFAQAYVLDLGLFAGTLRPDDSGAGLILSYAPSAWAVVAAGIAGALALLRTAWHRRSPGTATSVAASAVTTAALLLVVAGAYADGRLVPAGLVLAAAALVARLDRDALRRRPEIALFVAAACVVATVLLWGPHPIGTAPRAGRSARPG